MDHMDQSAASPRKRTPTACDHCRRRKTKCDGEPTGCQACKVVGLICAYGLRTRNISGQAYVAHLEQRVRDLESRLGPAAAADSGDDSSQYIPMQDHGSMLPVHYQTDHTGNNAYHPFSRAPEQSDTHALAPSMALAHTVASNTALGGSLQYLMQPSVDVAENARHSEYGARLMASYDHTLRHSTAVHEQSVAAHMGGTDLPRSSLDACDAAEEGEAWPQDCREDPKRQA